MSIYAIGDLHLSFGTDKPMNIFGDEWENFEERLKENWIKKIKDDDLVLLPGDFSWETYLKNTALDFKFINDLPGIKLLSKGNHDYWWTTITQMDAFIKEQGFSNIHFLMNTAFEYDGKVIVGTRGWSFNDTENSSKMEEREGRRLELSIQDGIKKYGEDKEFIAMIHYPPLTKQMISQNEDSIYTKILKKYGIKKCLYAHLHSYAHQEAFEGEIDGITYKLVSSDYLKFDPYEL